MIARPQAPLALLVLCGMVSSVVYWMGLTRPYPVPLGLERPLQHFGHLSGPSVAATLGLLVTLAAVFTLYLAALRLCRRLDHSRLALGVVYAGGALCALSLTGMYPVFSLDVFYYMATDRIWTVFRENPFLVPPLQAAHDPFFPYTRWGHYPSPYGPLWPWASAAASALGGGDIQATLLGFKALSLAAYLACLPLVTWATAQFRPDRRVSGTCLFAWNPLVLVELIGVAHNDAVALVPVALAVGLWARRRSASAALALAASVLVKATAIVAAPAFLWAGFARAMAGRRLPQWAFTHLLPALALATLAWLPFWAPGVLLSQFREGRQYYQTVTALAAWLFPPQSNPFPLGLVQGLLVLAFALVYLSQLRILGQEGPPALRSIWGLTILYFLVVAPFYAAWYMIWPTLYAAVLVERRVTALTVLLCMGGFGTYLVQFVLRPALNLPLALSGLVGLAVAVAPFLVGLVVLRGWAETAPGPRVGAGSAAASGCSWLWPASPGERPARS